MLTKNSVVAKVWANAVLQGNKTITDVPKLSNLQEMVYAVLDAQ